MIYMIEIDKIFKDVEDKKITELLEEFNSKEELLRGHITAMLIYFKLDNYLKSNDCKNIENYNELITKKNDLYDYIRITNNALFLQ